MKNSLQKSTECLDVQDKYSFEEREGLNCVSNMGEIILAVKADGAMGVDDKTDGFHFYLGYIKFGLGRATRDAMMEIRSGHITREEAVALVRRYDGEFPKKYFKDFLEYLDISEEYFWKIVDSYRPTHLWEKVNGEWKLKHQVN